MPIQTQDLTIEAKPSNLHLVRSFVAVTIREARMTARERSLLVLAVDEALTSMLSEAAPDSECCVSVDVDDVRVRVTLSAMDRSGKRHTVATHVHEENGNKQHKPSSDYMAIIVAGGRHWQLPAGWIAGLEEYVSG